MQKADSPATACLLSLSPSVVRRRSTSLGGGGGGAVVFADDHAGDDHASRDAGALTVGQAGVAQRRIHHLLEGFLATGLRRVLREGGGGQTQGRGSYNFV